MDRCKARKVRWAIFSDKYGVWFREVKHPWYEFSPDEALPRFVRLLADFDEKMKGFDPIYFCPGVGGPACTGYIAESCANPGGKAGSKLSLGSP